MAVEGGAGEDAGACFIDLTVPTPFPMESRIRGEEESLRGKLTIRLSLKY